jgi:hypothetical protein
LGVRLERGGGPVMQPTTPPASSPVVVQGGFRL